MKWLLKVFGSLATLSTIVVAQEELKYPCFNLPDTTIYSARSGEAFALPLCVQSVLSNYLAKSVYLDGFDINVRALYLGNKCPADLTTMNSLEPANQDSTSRWFRRASSGGTRYYSYDVDRQVYIRNSEYLQQHAGKIMLGELPLHTYSAEQRLAELNIRSQVRMEMNDVIDLGKFEFVTTKPGLYRIQMDLYRHQGKKNGKNGQEEGTAASRDLHVFFECAPHQPELTLTGPDLIQLHRIAYEYIHTPVINSVFFEKTDPLMFTQNETDHFFRSLLFGRIVSKTACPKATLQLYFFPDPLDDGAGSQDKTAPLELNKKRARAIQAHLDRLHQRHLTGDACRAARLQPGNTVYDTSDCGLSYDLESQNLDSRLAQLLIKSDDSLNEREKYREENRVVAVGIEGDEEWRLFEPFAIRQDELPEHLTFEARLDTHSTSTHGCLDSASVIVQHRGQTDSISRKLTAEEIAALSANELILRWGSSSLLDLLSTPGEYEAQIVLYANCNRGTQRSKPVAFRVEWKTVYFDEILALSPFDRAGFSNTYDEKRIPAIAGNILENIESELNRVSPGDTLEATLFISGHTDILSEHRGPYYNLGLSFERAHFIRQMIGDAIAVLAAGQGFGMDSARSNLDSNGTYYLSSEFQEKMRSPLFAKPSTQKLFRSLESTTQKSTEMSRYFSSLINQKLRHLRLDSQLGAINGETARLNKLVAARIDRIARDIPAGLTSFAFRKDGRNIRLRFVTGGFGATVPFFRRIELTPGLEQILCAGGVGPDAMPESIFADDDHPAGRVMNRRIEINLWIEDSNRLKPVDQRKKS